ncbi:MAG TPA: asparagine synthase-related protein, partial [Patescibacteria group bacterium]|nr:asparagine synthase-related protein [Patescibacteria group bacterium]
IDSMAVALEGRSPFLDHEMLELTAKIPFNLKIKGLNNKKYILKEALRGIIPDEVMFRPKMGFGVPIDSWFRGELKEYAYDILLSEKSIQRGLFRKEEMKKILDSHNATTINYSPRIWALLTLELWFREYF